MNSSYDGIMLNWKFVWKFFRVMLKGVMLITLFSLMRHPLFEWRSRTKMAALNDNFKLIIEVILPGIFIFFFFLGDDWLFPWFCPPTSISGIWPVVHFVLYKYKMTEKFIWNIWTRIKWEAKFKILNVAPPIETLP